MFRCIFFRKKLASYLEGELSEQERKRVENHLEGSTSLSLFGGAVYGIPSG